MIGTGRGLGTRRDHPQSLGPFARIRYSVPMAGRVDVSVYDVLGRRTATLAEGVMPPGEYQCKFDARGLACGLYFCRLEIGNRSATRNWCCSAKRESPVWSACVPCRLEVVARPVPHTRRGREDDRVHVIITGERRVSALHPSRDLEVGIWQRKLCCWHGLPRQ